MYIKLRGNAWYLKKTVTIDGVSKVKEFPLRLYGGEADRKKAEKKAATVAKDIDRANTAIDVMAEMGIEPAPKPTTAPRLTAYWEVVKTHYPGDRDKRAMTGWLELPHGQSTWGETGLDAFTRSDCEAAMSARRGQHRRTRSGKQTKALVSESTVRRDVRTVKAVFRRAINDRVIPHSPWDGIKIGGDQSRQRLLLHEEETKLSEELIPRHRRWVEFVLETGLRLEGIRDLRDDLVRQVNGDWLAHVSEKADSKHRHDICAICGRKGRKCREVPLMKRAQKIVKEQQRADGRLWSGLEGMASIQKALAQAARRAGIHRVSPHDLRHSFGHRWLKQGGSIDNLSRILGHSDSRITRKHYAHLLDTDLAAQMRAVKDPARSRAKRGGSRDKASRRPKATTVSA